MLVEGESHQQQSLEIKKYDLKLIRPFDSLTRRVVCYIGGQKNVYPELVEGSSKYSSPHLKTER